MHNNDPKSENNTTITLDEQKIEVSNDERNRNDKRYEEPFENDGAYADDSDSD